MKLLRWMKVVFLAVCFALVVNLPAIADQCAYVDKQQALAAVSRLNPGQMVYEYCQPCGDRRPKPLPIEALSASTTGYEDYWEVKINNSGIDLAYTFVDAGINNQKVNLAAVVGCPAVDVSTILP